MSADGYARALGRTRMAIARNGPGITGLVTPLRSAYYGMTTTSSAPRLNLGVEYAGPAEACGPKGVNAEAAAAPTEALRTAIDEQTHDGVTTFIEVVRNQDLGEPFRRNAVKTPVAVAGGIARADRRPQPRAV